MLRAKPLALWFRDNHTTVLPPHLNLSNQLQLQPVHPDISATNGTPY